jgi:hypothetical protein
MKLGEAQFGGGQSFLFFAERESDLGRAIAGVVVKARTRDAGNPDFFH